MILSLTSIPPRFKYLPLFFKHLAKLKQRPDHVELNINRNYRRFPGELPSLPPLPDWVTVSICDEDLGPATKILPTARRWRAKDVDLIYIDDDRIYEPTMLGRHAEHRRRYPEDVLCECGFGLDYLRIPRPRPASDPQLQVLPYEYFKTLNLVQTLSFGLIRPFRPRALCPGIVDIAEGFGGVSVKPDWFEDSDFDIPEVVWTVDDIWLSGHLTRRGRTLRTTDLPYYSHPLRGAVEASALADMVAMGHDRMTANRAAVRYFQERFGIWLPPEDAQSETDGQPA